MIYIGARAQNKTLAAACLLVVFLASFAYGVQVRTAEPLVFNSAKPQFARISLTHDESKKLGIAFDQSQGPGTRYDMIYLYNADTQGPITKFIKIKSSSSTSKGTTICSFDPTVLPVLFNDLAKEVEAPWTLQFETTHQKTEDYIRVDGVKRKDVKISDTFSIVATLCLKSENEWKYVFTNDIQPADSIASAQLLKFNNKPEITIDTHRLDPKDRKIGMNVNLVCGDNTFVCERNGGDTYINLEFIDEKGKVVKKDKNRVDRFNYEVSRREIRCGPGG
jgi:hypothetical protein